MNTDSRLIEHGFPCHQVGAETQRERGASSALPPLYYLHVWWARRPLTPSRAAILASLLPADADPELFVRSLGIEKKVALVDGHQWTLTGNLLPRVQPDGMGGECLPVDAVVERAYLKEQESRKQDREMIAKIVAKDPSLATDPAILKWKQESRQLPEKPPHAGSPLKVQQVMGDPAWYKQLMNIAKSVDIRIPNLYGYDRAFSNCSASHSTVNSKITILDPTSGGGSIPFEALRLGYKTIANELNPVATVILHATLDYPKCYGIDLIEDIEGWGEELLKALDTRMSDFSPRTGLLPEQELQDLKNHLEKTPELVSEFNQEEVTTYIFCRQVTCPHCKGEAPLLNSCWLSKESGKQWGVAVIPDGKDQHGRVRFEAYRVHKGHGPNGEDPDMATVNRGVGTCVHCRQAIPGDEIKAQARGESPFGQWQDRLYCVVATRFEPKLDKKGQPQRYATGDRAGEIKTTKVQFFRAPTERDLQALTAAEQEVQNNWDDWLAQDLVPTEKFPQGNDMRPVTYGMPRWCDMFTPRQLLGHVTLIKTLNELKPKILKELGEEKGKAVVTYLQFAIDKGLDYNSRQTRWEYTRGVVKGTFGRHDYSLKWTFGEMIFSGPSSGARWGLSQILDAYKGISDLLNQIDAEYVEQGLQIINGTAANISQIQDEAVDLICMDPPYYNNVQYSELSDYFYPWMKRTLKDLYPELFTRRLTNKKEEAVANPARDGSTANAKIAYERMMGEIFEECRRVLKDTGILTLMFTHKSQDAWETLIRSLINNGWKITSTFPVESESSASTHQKDMLSAASSIFIACRKQTLSDTYPSLWTGLGGRGVQKDIEQAVKQGLEEFVPLKLNPVDEMVASYGRALKVLSENWPVMDGDEEVSPIRAMNEASRVVAESHIQALTKGRIKVEDLDPETGMALTLFGIWGLNECNYDEVLNLSRSLNISLQSRTGGYTVDGRMIGINQEPGGRGRAARPAQTEGFHAPLVRKASKLRLAAPEERHPRRLKHPQTDWDVLHGLIQAYREGDIPVARPYLEQHAQGKEQRILDLLQVWATEMEDDSKRKEAETILFGLRS